jgi:hypothetical protein
MACNILDIIYCEYKITKNLLNFGEKLFLSSNLLHLLFVTLKDVSQQGTCIFLHKLF